MSSKTDDLEYVLGQSCCEKKNTELAKMAGSQRKVLWTVLLINAVMFTVEAFSGLYASSIALLGDSVDMLGDALAYAASLMVLSMGPLAKARSARFKGMIVLVSAGGVLAAAIYRVVNQQVPGFATMGAIGSLALLANVVCLVLLSKQRQADVNMASVWLCSRNDIIANISVLGAALLVSMTASHWPDLVVGFALAILYIKSAFFIFSEARKSVAIQ